MEEEKVKAIISNEITDATNFYDDEYSSDRITALDYYLGAEFGNEEDGKSRAIDTVVADTIDSIMPALLRIFTSGDDYVRFAPRLAEDVKKAEQATDYVNFIINNDNDAFRIFYNWLKDALLFRMGVVKFFVEEKDDIKTEEYRDLNDDEFGLLASNPDVEITAHTERKEEIFIDAEMPEGAQNSQTVHDVDIKRKKSSSKIKIDNIPPEEFLFNRRAKTLEDAYFVCHRTTVTVSDLVAMGYDKDEVEEHAGINDLDNKQEVQLRHQEIESSSGLARSDPSMREVEYYEIYLKSDLDEDGIAELNKIIAIGHNGSHILEQYPCDQIPFAIISPILMPHRMVGRSIYDLTGDLQLIKSTLLRQYLDNTYAVNNSRMVAVEGQVNIDDLIDNVAGGVIRARTPNAVMPLSTPTVGGQILPLMEQIDRLKEERTGMSKASMGLDADSLQSTSAVGINATIKSAQSKIEMYARTISETGVKDLFKGILHLVTKVNNKPRIIRLRNEYVPIDPTEWDTEFDMQVEVGLGRGNEDDQLRGLSMILAEQKQIMQTLGVQNEIVKPEQYLNTIKRMAEISGFKDTEQFFSVPKESEQRPQTNPQEQAMAMAQQAEQQKLQAEEMRFQAEMELKREKLMLEMELKREEMQLKLELRKQELATEASLRKMQVESENAIKISTNLPTAQ